MLGVQILIGAVTRSFLESGEKFPFQKLGVEWKQCKI